jgi:UDP-N-acetylglucosamine acyltransferase
VQTLLSENKNSPLIHPTAIIEDGAVIGNDTRIGPYCVIQSRVNIGAKCTIHSHVTISGNTIIGEENNIFPFASIGYAPQDLKFRGEDSTLIIGNRNIIREYATLQPGTAGGGMKTVVGDNNLFMASTHVAHDVTMGNNNIMANSAALAGHVTIGNSVRIMGLAGVHQFVKIGDLACIAAGAMVSQDIPPYCMVHGDRATSVGLNIVGMKRAGLSNQEISEIKDIYRQIFLNRDSNEGISRKLEKLLEKNLPKVVNDFIAFICSSTRGIISSKRDGVDDISIVEI